jgi:hypothetical protein
MMVKRDDVWLIAIKVGVRLKVLGRRQLTHLRAVVATVKGVRKKGSVRKDFK